MQRNLVPNRGNYRTLICYRKAEVIYDITYYFAHNFLDKKDRTIDQMVQAARSGKQNIVEGYESGATSVETELKLINVAKSSLCELLTDYEDYLRTRCLIQWDSSSEEFRCAQELGRQHNDSAYWMELISSRSSEVIANIAIILLHQCDYLIYKFLQSLSKRYETEGGFREKLCRKRKSILP